MDEKILNYDILIIGSGAGGGTVAKELSPLCRKGAKIALLEWGGRINPADNTRQEMDMVGKYYFDNGGFQTSSQDMTLAYAKGVGGSTNVYTGVTFKIPDSVLEKWNIPGIESKDMAPRMEKYIRENNVSYLPLEKINRNNRVFAEACEKLGWSHGQFPLNIRDCKGLNTCNLGCPEQAKQGTAVVQIPQAEKNGVEVIPFCRAERIEGQDVIARVMPPKHGLEPSPLKPGRYRFRGRKIVICAGTMNSAPLLMRSFGKNFSDAIGRYFTCHPALTLVAEHHDPINGSIGHPKSYYCDEFVKQEKFLLETCMYFPFTAAKNLCGFGEEPDALMSRFSHLQMLLILVLDKARYENRITIDRNGNPIVHYRIDSDIRNSFVSAMQAGAKIFFASGAYRAHIPASEDFFIYADQADRLETLISSRWFKSGQISLSAAHMMGGCRMGTDPKTSVCNSWGKVHGFEHLYVADASLFPDSAEVNPYLTIMALADRVAEGIRRDLGFE